MKVPPAEPIEMDFAPFGSNVTLLVPALTAPEKLISLAVIEIAELVVDRVPVAPLVTLPVPSVVIVTPLVPVAELLMTIAALEPDDVCSTNVLPEMALEVVIVPVAVRVRVPLVEVTVPDVPMVAEAPVVVMEKAPPTLEVPIVTAPALLTSAVPGLPALAVMVVAAVKIGVPEEPIAPVPEVRFTVGAVKVTAPDRVMVPEPLADTLILPEVPELILTPSEMLELLADVDRLTAEAPDMVIALLLVKVPPELTVTDPEVPVIVPSVVVLDAPTVVIDRFFVPVVMVCPLELNVPPLFNCKS